MSRRPLFSVRHRTSRRPFDVLYKKVQFQLVFLVYSCSGKAEKIISTQIPRIKIRFDTIPTYSYGIFKDLVLLEYS